MMSKGATFDASALYRYTLWRVWDTRKPNLNIIGLNPSTADENKDDPTIRRCIGFAQRWGYGGLVMTNLFAYRATDPRNVVKLLAEGGDPGGPENEGYLVWTADTAARVIVAWGALPKPLAPYGRALADALTGLKPLYCLGLTKEGYPRHPLYVRGDAEPLVYRERYCARIVGAP